MGKFLNSIDINNRFIRTTAEKYFIDKSGLIEKFNKLIGTSNDFVSITRPRRFGKSINAMMLASYYSNTIDTRDVFDKLNISKCPSYLEHLNKHNVIYISFNTNINKFKNYDDYINYFERRLMKDLKAFYPDLEEDEFLSDMFDEVNQKTGQGFIFIFDEWDYIFNNNLYSKDDRKNFLTFLTVLLKNKPYVEFAYITGILPIAKYSSSTSLNNFMEFDAISDTLYDEYFGFLEDEVVELCKKQNKVSMQELQEWYNGYYTSTGTRIYNPRSVSYALQRGTCQSYWTGSGPKKELLPYINSDINGIKSDIINMLAGNPVKIRLAGFDAEVEDLNDENLVLSAMTILGYLSYHDMELRIPNKELLLEFKNTLINSNVHGLSSIVVQSNAMLKATLQQDTETMAKILEVFHASYLSYFDYNRENALACIITLAYLCARDMYIVSREDVAGLGRADFIFYPLNPRDTAFILELKVDDTPESAIKQILDKKYDVKLAPYTGKKLAIGISYYTNDETKKHHVVIKEL